jgi:hypothetical protein
MRGLLSTDCTSRLNSNIVEQFQDVAQVDLCILVFGRLGLSMGLGGMMSL